MSNVQSNLPITNGAPALPEPVQGGLSARSPMAQGETGGTSENASPDEHSLLSRPAAPQYRRSLFRR